MLHRRATKTKLRGHTEKISERVQRQADLAATTGTANAIQLIDDATCEHEKPEQRECNQAAVRGRSHSPEGEKHEPNEHDDARFAPSLIDRVSKRHTRYRPNEK